MFINDWRKNPMGLPANNSNSSTTSSSSSGSTTTSETTASRSSSSKGASSMSSANKPSNNLKFSKMLFQGWPFILLYVCSEKGVKQGEEMILDYGNGYWADARNLEDSLGYVTAPLKQLAKVTYNAC